MPVCNLITGGRQELIQVAPHIHRNTQCSCLHRVLDSPAKSVPARVMGKSLIPRYTEGEGFSPKDTSPNA